MNLLCLLAFFDLTLNVKALTVHWQKHPKPCNSWFDISQLNPITRNQFDDLEQQLSFPKNTVGILQAAFQKNLNRFTGWDLSNVSPQLAPAFKKAAEIYKRGVISSKDVSRGTLVNGSYPVEIINNITFNDRDKHWFIIDENVERAWQISHKLKNAIIINITELTKTLESVAKILSIWSQLKKPDVWHIIGGGVLTDVAAFASYLTNSTFISYPTTLLAMIDSSIGGKTGVNFLPFGKNQLGAFHFPQSVNIWPGWLKTLNPRQLRAGIAEGLKHCILKNDKTLFSKIINISESEDFSLLNAILLPIIKVKADIVASDPEELKIRTTLNLGHTLAHALETYAHQHAKPEDMILHGEAVAIGLYFCALLSCDMQLLDNDDFKLISSGIKQAKLFPTKQQFCKLIGCDDLAAPQLFSELYKYILVDKKIIELNPHQSSWVLLRSFGEVVHIDEIYVTNVERTTIFKTWEKFIQEF